MTMVNGDAIPFASGTTIGPPKLHPIILIVKNNLEFWL